MKKIPYMVVKHTLDNYDNRYTSKSFENFDIQKIDKHIKNISISTVNEIKTK